MEKHFPVLRRSSLPTPSPAGLPICKNIWISLQSSWCRIIHGISLLCNISTLERRVGRSKGSGSNFSRNNPLFGFKSSIDARSPHQIKSSQNNGFVGLWVYLTMLIARNRFEWNQNASSYKRSCEVMEPFSWLISKMSLVFQKGLKPFYSFKKKIN